MRKWVMLALLGIAGFWFWTRRRQAEPAWVAEPIGAAQTEDQRIVLPPWPAVPNREDALGELEKRAEETVALDSSSEQTRATASDGIADLIAAETATIEEIAQAQLAASALTSANLDRAGAGTETGETAAAPDDVMGYCVRCKDQRPMVNTRQYRTSNKRPALRGECGVCGAGMFKFMKE